MRYALEEMYCAAPAYADTPTPSSVCESAAKDAGEVYGKSYVHAAVASLPRAFVRNATCAAVDVRISYILNYYGGRRTFVRSDLLEPAARVRGQAGGGEVGFRVLGERAGVEGVLEVLEGQREVQHRGVCGVKSISWVYAVERGGRTSDLVCAGDDGGCCRSDGEDEGCEGERALHREEEVGEGGFAGKEEDGVIEVGDLECRNTLAKQGIYTNARARGVCEIWAVCCDVGAINKLRGRGSTGRQRALRGRPSR